MASVLLELSGLSCWEPLLPSSTGRILETTVTKRILVWLRKQPECFAWKVHGHPGQMTGIPDISLTWKGWSVYIEVKSPDNKKGPTAQQQLRMDQIRAAGGIAFEARSLAKVKEELSKLDART